MSRPAPPSTADFDVVVVGAGPAGMAAAVAAAESGARVVVLEALDEIDGNAIWSTGYLAFSGFDMQHRAGVSDSVERFFDDAAAEVARQRERYGIVWDEVLTRRFIEGSADTYRYRREHGVAFNRFIERPHQRTAHRMVDLADTFSLQRAFVAAFADCGVEVRHRHRGRRLVVADGIVTGIDVETPDGPSRFHARAVVLATGGYQAGIELRRRYQPEHLATTPYLGVPTCRGDGHVMGQAVGGDLINMTMVQPLVIVGSALVEDSIAVNSAGVRFHDGAAEVPALPLARSRRVIEGLVRRAQTAGYAARTYVNVEMMNPGATWEMFEWVRAIWNGRSPSKECCTPTTRARR